MVDRLILGCDVLGNADVESIADAPGDLRVVDPDAVRVRTLRDAGITAESGDPGDPTQIEAGPIPGVVFVGGTDRETNLRAVRATREAYPDAHLIACAPGDAEANGRIAERADRVIDTTEAVAGAVLEAGTGSSDAPFRELRQVLRGVSGRFGVFMHSDPDPDAIGSALALRDIARAQGVDAAACYFGEIAHQENRALVNLLGLDLQRLDPTKFDLEEFGGIALVDHSRPGVNDDLPPDTSVDVVIDHHPPRGSVDATLLDVRTDVGATSTLLVDHLRGLDVDIDDRVATALLHGIRVDTRDFSRDITGTDFEAAAVLLSRADTSVLERVEQPSISGDTFDTIGRAIKNYEREESIVVSSAGRIAHRDAIAQAADQLLLIEGVTVAVVFGFTDETAHVSGRTQGSDVDIGETMRHAFAGLGSAGGHTDMAGGQLRIDTLGEIAEDGQLTEGTVGGVITGRLFEELDIQWSPPRPGSDTPVGKNQLGERP
ncbi:MAG: DHHA1 domain-containing protein [Halobacteriales archaeon]